MAVYQWIWGNANFSGDAQEFRVRFCDPYLQPFMDSLIHLSIHLASSEFRNSAFTQNCWFAGFLDQSHSTYFVALAGEQNQLLHIPLLGSRGLFCTLAFAFTEDDIHLYQQNINLFNPLSQIMRDINSGNPIAPLSSLDLSIHCRKFLAPSPPPSSSSLNPNCNIFKSSPSSDASLWFQSLQKPAMSGLLSLFNAQELLKLFPNGLASTIENTNLPTLFQPPKMSDCLRNSTSPEQEKTTSFQQQRKQQAADLAQAEDQLQQIKADNKRRQAQLALQQQQHNQRKSFAPIIAAAIGLFAALLAALLLSNQSPKSEGSYHDYSQIYCSGNLPGLLQWQEWYRS